MDKKSFEGIRSLAIGFDLLNTHLMILDKGGRIIYANKAVETHLGFSIDKLLGKTPADFWAEKNPHEILKNVLHKIVTEKQPFLTTVRQKRKNGSEFLQEVHLLPIFDKRGEIQFIIGIEPFFGVKQEEKEQMHDKMVSVVGHQLRNPLMVVSWALELLLNDRSFTRIQRHKIREVYEKNHELISLVTDLLTFIRGAQYALQQGKVDLSEEIKGIIQNVKQRNPEVSFRFEKAEGEFLLLTNKSLANQVFSNIIFNAAEYADRKSGEVIISLERNDNFYLFSSENNGAAISKKDQDKIFAPFFRAKYAQKIKKKGVGIGLFIVKTIADGLGWALTFKSPSRDDAGTVFYIKIPKTPALKVVKAKMNKINK